MQTLAGVAIGICRPVAWKTRPETLPCVSNTSANVREYSFYDVLLMNCAAIGRLSSIMRELQLTRGRRILRVCAIKLVERAICEMSRDLVNTIMRELRRDILSVRQTRCYKLVAGSICQASMDFACVAESVPNRATCQQNYSCVHNENQLFI